jgi:hypothetical protein
MWIAPVMHNGSSADDLPKFASSTQQMRDSALLRATTELFAQELVHDRDEIRRFEELAAHLLPKVPVGDRVFVAERLAIRLDAPPAVVRALARDRIDVAAPVLRGSPVLGPLDLLAVIAGTGRDHHALIAGRPGLPVEVETALRIAGDREGSTCLKPSETPAPLAISARRGTAEMAESANRSGARSPGYHEPREPGTSRFDPWLFLDLDRPARVRMMAELATRPPVRRYAGPTGRLDRAFRSILGAAQIVSFARSGQKQAVVEAIAENLGLAGDLVQVCLDDASGEPLAVLLKALGLDNVQAQQVFLLAAPTVGRDVTAFFRLCDLYAGMEAVVAETLAEFWREPVQATPRHEPLFAENGGARRGSVPEQARERPSPAAEWSIRGSAG